MEVGFLIPKDNLTYKNISTVISVLFASIIKFLSLYISEFRGIVICDQENNNLDCLPIDYTIKNMEKIKKYSDQINIVDSRRILSMINIAEILIDFLDKFTKPGYRDYVITDMFEKNRLHKLIKKAEDLIKLNSESMKYKYAMYNINDLPSKIDTSNSKSKLEIEKMNTEISAIESDLDKAIGKVPKEEKSSGIYSYLTTWKKEKPQEQESVKKDLFGNKKKKSSHKIAKRKL